MEEWKTGMMEEWNNDIVICWKIDNCRLADLQTFFPQAPQPSVHFHCSLFTALCSQPSALRLTSLLRRIFFDSEQ